MVLRVTRGDGDERPEPVGENICKLAEGSRDMLSLAVRETVVMQVAVAGHAGGGSYARANWSA